MGFNLAFEGLISQYISSLILLVVHENNNQFKINYEIQNINTRNKLNFYQPSSYPSVFHKGPCYMGSYVMDCTTHVKVLTNNIKQSESSLLGFLHQYTFYTTYEYFNHQHT